MRGWGGGDWVSGLGKEMRWDTRVGGEEGIEMIVGRDES